MVSENSKIKVALIGPYPPPYGGVSIHVQRLEALLSSNNIECTVYDTTSLFKDTGPKDTVSPLSSTTIKRWPCIFKSRGGIAHIHSSGAQLRKIIPLTLLLKILGKKIIITYQSLRDDVERYNRFKKKIAKTNFGFLSHFIVVNSQIKQKLLFLGVNPEQITVLPSFLPPLIRQQHIYNIPKGIWDFIENHTPIISANAFKIVFYNNQDLYGIDMCIDLCASLQNAYPEVGLVFCLPDIGDYQYFNKLRREIAEKGIENSFLFVTQPCQFYPVIMKSDILVRPTNTDGDSVSIREALYFKVPVVASDVVPRPEGTVLFKNRDINDFILRVKDILDNYEWNKGKLEVIKSENHFEKFMEVYQS